MKFVDGWHWPDGERHMLEWIADPANRIMILERPSYQGKKQLAVLRYCSQDRRRTFVDVGAHIGLWSWNFAHWFDHVEAFEPVADHQECFAMNMSAATNWSLQPFALGDREDKVAISRNPTSSGDSWVKGAGDIEMRTLDSFNLQGVDLIKVDCEGYEEFVLRGAAKTIARTRPVIIVEQKRDFATKFGLQPQGGVDYLKKEHAYRQAEVINGDYIMVSR